MTTLELLSDSPPYRFKSLGVYNPRTHAFAASDDFPTDTEYELTAGKFPLTDYKDLFSQSELYHTLDENIEVKITGFTNSCQEGHFNKYSSCEITVEKKATTGGRKNKSNRRKSNRRKSNRRKSNRRR